MRSLAALLGGLTVAGGAIAVEQGLLPLHRILFLLTATISAVAVTPYAREEGAVRAVDVRGVRTGVQTEGDAGFGSHTAGLLITDSASVLSMSWPAPRSRDMCISAES